MKNQNITKKLFYSFAAASLLSIAACSSDDDSVIKETSKIEFKDFSVEVAAGDTTLSFYAGANWRAALSSTSWIQIDPMTKAGSKGESKIILNWSAYTGITSRSTELTITVDGENPVVIRISQLPNEPIVVVNKTASLLQIDRKANGGRGLFCDTLMVESNVKWTVKQEPKWVDYEVIGSTEPQEGVPTSIKVVLKGKPNNFDAAVMEGDFVLGRSGDDSMNNTIAVQAVSELNVINADTEEPLSKVILKASPEAGGRFVGRMVIAANTNWNIANIPAWVAYTSDNNTAEYAQSLITRKTVSFEVKDSHLDTEAMNQTIEVKDDRTGLKSTVELVFEGTGNDYFESKLFFPPDFIFDASTYTPNWEPIEGTVLSMDFDMVSAKDYATLDEAPFEFFFVKTNEIKTFKEEVKWAFVDFAEVQTRAALNTKRLTLRVKDRNMDWEDFDKTEQRNAYIVVVPKGTSFDDMFVPGTEDLKEEYFLSSRLVRQKPIAKEMPEIDIPSEISFTSAGGSQSYGIRNFYGCSFMIDGNTTDAPGSWVLVQLEKDEDTDETIGARIIAQPNNTGKARSCVVDVVYYNTATEMDETIYSFTVNQD